MIGDGFLAARFLPFKKRIDNLAKRSGWTQKESEGAEKKKVMLCVFSALSASPRLVFGCGDVVLNHP
jgi:hypothetical protein